MRTLSFREVLVSKSFHIIFITLWCSLIILRLGTEGVINVGDTYFELDSKDAFFRQIYAWEPKISGGHNFIVEGSTRVVTNGFLLLLSSIGINTEIANRLWFISSLLIQVLGAYYLVLVLLKEDKNRNIYALLAAFFFLSNPQTYNHILGTPNISLARGMMNFAFALYLRGMNERTVSLKYAFLAAIAISVSFVDVRFMAFVGILLASFLVFRVLLGVRNGDLPFVLRITKFSGLVLLFTLLLNLFWFLDMVEGVLRPTTFISTFYSQDEATEVLSYISSLAPLCHTLRLGREIASSDTCGLILYNTKWFLLFSSITLMLIAYSSIILLISKRGTYRYHMAVYFLLLLVVSLCFAGGTKGPCKGLYLFLWNNIPIFKTFRIPLYFLHFSVLAATGLFAISIAELYQRLHLKKRFTLYGSIVLFTLIVVNGFPFYYSGFPATMAPAVIPPYYYNMAAWLKQNNDKDARLFIMPPLKSNIFFAWSRVDMADVFFTLSPLPLLVSTNRYGHSDITRFNKTVSDLFETGKVEEAVTLLSLKNVGYVMLRQDIRGKTLKENKVSIHQDEVKTIIGRKRNIQFLKPAKSFGKLDLFRIPEDYFTPHIYATPNLTIVNNISLLPFLSSINYKTGKRPAIIFANNEDETKIVELEKEIPATFYWSCRGDFSKEKHTRSNPLDKKTFYVPRASRYLVTAGISPKKFFMRNGSLINNTCGVFRPSRPVLTGWDVHSENERYEQSVSEQGLHEKAYFEKPRNVKEDFILTKQFFGIRLKDNPCIVLSYLLENPLVQDVAFNIWFKDREGNKIHDCVTLHPDSQPSFESPGYSQNLYELAGKSLGVELLDELEIDKVDIVLTKKRGIATTDNSIRGDYSFTLKQVAFLRYAPIVTHFGDTFTKVFSPENFHYFDGKGELKTAESIEEIPSYVTNFYESKRENFINLKDQPFLAFTFQMPNSSYISDLEQDSFPADFMVSLALDFNGDKKQDEEIELFLPAIPTDTENLCMNIDAYKEVRKKFPDKDHYNLLGLSIGHPDDKEKFYQEVGSNTLTKYETHAFSTSDFARDAEVLTVDGTAFRLPKDHEKDEGNGLYSIEFEAIHLEEGNHVIAAVDKEKFQVEMMSVRPAVNSQLSTASNRVPEIDFRKINPTKYIVDVKGAKVPFILIFSENFHGGWEAYIRPKPGGGNWPLDKNHKNEPKLAPMNTWKNSGEKTRIKSHFVANGYANGWFVPVGQAGINESPAENESIDQDNFQILLEYKPQKLFQIGGIISAFTLLMGIGCIAYNVVRTKAT